jgi:predicted metal-dependent hydrolase
LIPIEGRETRIVWDERLPRTPVLVADELRCGGPESGLARRIESFLRGLALERMSVEVAEYSAAAGVSASGVSVGDPASRWGSCSSRGKIRLSWRLILAPASVRRYVVAHEVAHLKHLNHGPAFKALEAKLFGTGLSQAKAVLCREGPRLRRIGRLR